MEKSEHYVDDAAFEAAEKQKELEQAAQEKKEIRKRWLWFFSFVIIGSLFIGLISLNHRLGKAEDKVETAKTDVALINAKYENLSDSVKKIVTLVKDTMYPILSEQQSYIKVFEKKFKSVNSNLSYISSRQKKVDENVNSFRANQTTFASAFNKDLREVKSKYDSLDVQVKKPVIVQSTVVAPLVLPVDTQPKTLVVKDKKTVNQKNGGHGGQRKLRFDKILGKPTSKSFGW